jgi:hypothetical protein
MIAVFCISSEKMTSNATDAIKYIENSEGIYPKIFYNNESCTLDNFTERTMLQRVSNNNDLNVLENAMSCGGYSRYWHGYLVFLKPMLCFLSYIQIRIVILFVYAILLFSLFFLLAQKFNFPTALFFLISMLCVKAFIIPASLQFVSVFNIMFIFCIWLLTAYDKNQNDNKMLVFFLVIGSITSFIDLLTAPLITLGIPLIIYLLLSIQNQKSFGFMSGIKKLFLTSLSWCIGYGATWIAKWLIGSAILQQNVLADAFSTGSFRMFGNEKYPLDRYRVMAKNIYNLLGLYDTILCGLCVVIFIVWIALVCRYKKPWAECKKFVPIAITSVFPYIWYNVMASHSQIHHWFTYRAQIITLFAVLVAMYNCINISKLRNQWSNRRLSKKQPNVKYCDEENV